MEKPNREISQYWEFTPMSMEEDDLDDYIMDEIKDCLKNNNVTVEEVKSEDQDL